MTVLADAVSWCAGESLLFADESSPFSATVSAHGGSPVVLVTGDNASGKSAFFRLLAAVLRRDADAFAVTLSIRERTGGGTEEMGRMRQSLIYGDETQQSTGAVSVRSIRSGFENADRDDGRPTALMLDEPELGLSEGYARALGEYVGTQSQSLPPGCAGVVIVTHSRPLVRGLLSSGAEPTHVHCGGAADLASWCETEEDRSVAELLALPDVSLARFRETHKLLGE